MIQKRFLLLMLIMIAIISTASCISLLLYFDPYSNVKLGISLLGVSLFLSITGFFSVILYFCKKIYFRGDVYVYNVLSSIRQAGFFALYILGLGFLVFSELPVFIPALLISCVFVFLELFIRSIR